MFSPKRLMSPSRSHIYANPDPPGYLPPPLSPSQSSTAAAASSHPSLFPSLPLSGHPPAGAPRSRPALAPTSPIPFTALGARGDDSQVLGYPAAVRREGCRLWRTRVVGLVWRRPPLAPPCRRGGAALGAPTTAMMISGLCWLVLHRCDFFFIHAIWVPIYDFC